MPAYYHSNLYKQGNQILQKGGCPHVTPLRGKLRVYRHIQGNSSQGPLEAVGQPRKLMVLDDFVGIHTLLFVTCWIHLIFFSVFIASHVPSKRRDVESLSFCCGSVYLLLLCRLHSWVCTCLTAASSTVCGSYHYLTCLPTLKSSFILLHIAPIFLAKYFPEIAYNSLYDHISG